MNRDAREDQSEPAEPGTQSGGGERSVGDPQEGDDRFVIAVVRSGGIAGRQRRWMVEPPGPETATWVALVNRCPWDAPPQGGSGADRFLWSIQVRTPHEERARELADTELRGAWRDLVDAVREADAGS